MGEGKWLFRDEARLALTMVEAHDGYVGVCAAIFFFHVYMCRRPSFKVLKRRDSLGPVIDLKFSIMSVPLIRTGHQIRDHFFEFP